MPCSIERSLLRPGALQNQQVDRAVEIIMLASTSVGGTIKWLMYHNDQFLPGIPVIKEVRKCCWMDFMEAPLNLARLI